MTAIEAIQQAIYDRLSAFSPWPVYDSIGEEASLPCAIVADVDWEADQNVGMPDAYVARVHILCLAEGDTTRPLDALMATVSGALDEASVRDQLSGSGWSLIGFGLERSRRLQPDSDGIRQAEVTVEAYLEPSDIEIPVPVPDPCGPGLQDFCLGAWDMATLEGSAIRDLSGAGNHLSLSASGATITGSGVALNGSSGFLRSSTFSAGGGVTTSAIAVVQFTSVAAGGALAHIGADTSSGGNYLTWRAASNGVLYVECGKSGGYDNEQPSSSFNPTVDSVFRAYGLGLSVGSGFYTTRWWKQDLYEQKTRGTQLLAHTNPGLTVGVIWNTSAPRAPYPYYLNGSIAWLSLFSKQLTDSEYQAELLRIRAVLADREVSI